ncbi:uncharacterized protein LOC123402898 [Hordeum vulgare subsp. vulgare]|uniref:Predicted protein n=1 Tax=Hordeum vulgare subsp. vulgare TaxID=112509 RepID=F2EEG7_HORVV|nr:uncharacterized protein LOC123402898 [Hordeum vulgare subsp. vulgare]BAK05739.1 predicted protein [Hordeum vulgare subsp. vulgare]
MTTPPWGPCGGARGARPRPRPREGAGGEAMSRAATGQMGVALSGEPARWTGVADGHNHGQLRPRDHNAGTVTRPRHGRGRDAQPGAGAALLGGGHLRPGDRGWGAPVGIGRGPGRRLGGRALGATQVIASCGVKVRIQRHR